VKLHINESLPKGLYRFRVFAKADDGWSGVFDVTHFAPGMAATKKIKPQRHEGTK
jgi:hypothetical protein